MQNVRSRSYLSYCDFLHGRDMPQRGRHFFASARGRLLFFNLLVVTVTLMVSGVAVLGFQHASQIRGTGAAANR